MFKCKYILVVSIFVSLLFLIFLIAEGIGYSLIGKKRSAWVSYSHLTNEKIPIELGEKNRNLLKRKEKLFPKGMYIVVDTAQNTLYLRKGNQIIRKAVISCGSGNILKEPGGKRKWVFDTPRGEFGVKFKIKDPSWVKPDWAFIEEGESIPQKFVDRVEDGVLGDYALGFGNGYFIHGTLYKRLLGKNVTHGCIRVGDEDLKAVFDAASLGTKIFIF